MTEGIQERLQARSFKSENDTSTSTTVKKLKDAAQYRMDVQEEKVSRARRHVQHARAKAAAIWETRGMEAQDQRDATIIRLKAAAARKAAVHDTWLSGRELHSQRVMERLQLADEEAVATLQAAKERRQAAKQRREDRYETWLTGRELQTQRVMERLQLADQEAVATLQAGKQRRLAAKLRRDDRMDRMVNRLMHHLDNVETTKCRIYAIRFLQRWYKNLVACRSTCSQLRRSPAWIQLNEALLSLKDASFETAMDILQKTTLLQATQQVLVLFPPSRALKSRPARLKTSRVFLMSAMITHHGTTVLETPTEEASTPATRALQDTLIFHSKKLLKSLHTLHTLLSLEILPFRQSVTALSTFAKNRVLYVDAFLEWKNMDAQRLSSELIGQYAKLYASNVWTSLNVAQHASDEDRVHEIVARTTMQCEELQVTLTKMIGFEETKGRLMEVRTNVEEGMMIKYEEEQERIMQEKEDKKNDHVEVKSSKMKRKASPSKQETSSSLKKPDLAMAKTVFSNAQLAHELILDSSYQLETPSTSSASASSQEEQLMLRVQENMKKAFWDHLILDIKKGDDLGTVRLLSQMIELRTALLSVLGNTTEDFQQVSELLHEDVLKRHLTLSDTTGGLQWPLLVSDFLFVLEMIMKNEAPIRVEKTKDWHVKLSETVNEKSSSTMDPFTMLPQLFEFIFEKIDLLRLDALNAHLRILAPYLQRHGVEHERKKIAETVSENGNALNNTKKWMESSLRNYYAHVSAETRTLLHGGVSTAFSDCLQEAFMNLIEVQIAQEEKNWPETFAMDIKHIRNMRDVVDTVALQASFLALMKQYLGQLHVTLKQVDVLEWSVKFKTLVKDASITASDLATQVVADTSTLAQQAGKDMSSEEAAAMLGQVTSVMEPGNPVFALFFGRSMKVLGLKLSEKKESEGGSNFMEMELEEVAVKAKRLLHHNEAVYATYYNEMIRTALVAQVQIVD